MLPLQTLSLVLSFVLLPASLLAAEPVKEWTFLTYLNGVNNLDTYGGININQMERVGSGGHVNVVVQWASENSGTTRRLLVQRDDDTRKINSPVLEEFKSPDMGNWQTLVEFIRWGVAHFPAKHYFINIWGHGTGWHEPEMPQFAALGAPIFFPIRPYDISEDDHTNHAITTRQLGMAMAEAARIIGHKVDIYGSDACLMSMVEIAAEMSDSVEVFAGSQATEPGDGWPYADFLGRWMQKTAATPAEVVTMLTESYIAAIDPHAWIKEATFSALDLSRLPALVSKFSSVSSALQKIAPEQKTGLLRSLPKTVRFSEPDYLDFGDFLSQLEANHVSGITDADFAELRKDLKDLVIANKTTPRYARATGVSLWVASDRDKFDRFSREYLRLKFHAATNWGEALQVLVK